MAWEGFSGPASGIRTVDSFGTEAQASSPGQPQSAQNPTISNFPSDDELLGFAKLFVNERIESLKKDVRHCLTEPYAPFPAILYAISTIEMLGALVKGEASRKKPLIDPSTGLQRINSRGQLVFENVDTGENTEHYMIQYMHYNPQQSELIMQIFRHKMSHLAQPKPVLRIATGELIGWEYHHEDRQFHLGLTPAPTNTIILITKNWPQIRVDQIFHLSIMQLVDDIEKSLFAANGYLEKLAKNEDNLFDNFKTAINQIYSDAK